MFLEGNNFPILITTYFTGLFTNLYRSMLPSTASSALTSGTAGRRVHFFFSASWARSGRVCVRVFIFFTLRWSREERGGYIFSYRLFWFVCSALRYIFPPPPPFFFFEQACFTFACNKPNGRMDGRTKPVFPYFFYQLYTK